jgi:hypothetical protein
MSNPSPFSCLARPDSLVRPTPISPARRFERQDLTNVFGAGLAAKLAPTTALATQQLGMATPFKANVPAPLTLRLRIIYTTNDQGQTDGQPAPTKEALLPIFTALVDSMRQDWAGTGINFLFLPNCDFEIRKDSRLNNDFSLPPDVLKTFPASQGTYTQAQIDELKSKYSNTAYRNKVAAERPNTLLWLVCEPNNFTLQLQPKQKPQDADVYKWVYLAHNSGSWSGGDVDFVVLNKYDFAQSAQHSREDASRAAHETGHFLHLWHTHREPQHDEATASADPIPKDPAARLARWRKGLEAWLDANTPANTSPAQALQVYDSDRGSGVTDTPADPGAGLLGLANLVANGTEDALGPVATVTINPKHVTGPVVFQPDRNNPMSYFLGGKPEVPMQFSAGQIDVMRGALTDGNRRRLVGAQLGDTSEPSVRICAVWSPNTKGQGYSWGLTVDALKAKHAEHTGKQFHLSSQCAYVEQGTVRYDAVWDEGARPQHVIWGWLDTDVLAEVAKQAAQGWRVVQVQAYRHPGTGLRYNVVFEQGGPTQQVLLNKTQAELDQAWQKLMPTGMRLSCLNAAVNEKGQVCYAAVFAPGAQQQRYIAGWALADIAAEYGKEWALNHKLSAISVVWTPDGPRYSAIWNPDSQGQLVMWLHVRERIREVYDEMWCQGFKLRAISTLTT